MTIDIGNTIKNLRTKKGVTQKQLAAYLGITDAAVSRWENGTGYPDIEMLPSIASYFSVTADELLGINRDERTAHLAAVRRKMKLIDDAGDNDTEEAVEQARIWAAEFPGEEDVQEYLACTICRYTMWDERPKKGLLEEAEKIYTTLIETTADPEFRSCIIEQLAVLYAVGFRDLHRAEITVDRLPKMRCCREEAKANMFSYRYLCREESDRYIIFRQDYIRKLTDSLALTMLHYIDDDIPDDPDRLDEKIGYLETLIHLYHTVFGDNMLFFHDRVSSLWRVIATYYLDQEKYDDALTALEKMTEHAVLCGKIEPGTAYSSPFTDRIVYEGQTADCHINEAHNCAYYCRNRMHQERYDPIRDTERFRAVLASLDENAE
ncbi:MAG: helix-turn-helix transcriptional regulator [Clostridia bacterium]|nr:helix-turn-helix transcriptional regulator [Clostridia bacterium]